MFTWYFQIYDIHNICDITNCTTTQLLQTIVIVTHRHSNYEAVLPLKSQDCETCAV